MAIGAFAAGPLLAQHIVALSYLKHGFAWPVCLRGAWARELPQTPEVADDGRVLLTSFAAACMWSAAGVHEVALPGLPMDAGFTPTGARFVLYDAAQDLVVWDGVSGAVRARGRSGSMAAMLAIAGGDTLALLQSDGSLQLRTDGETRALLPAVAGTERRQGGLALATDGRTLAVYMREASELR